MSTEAAETTPDLHRKAERILCAIAARGGVSNTAEIRQVTGLSSSDISSTHAPALVRHGLVKEERQVADVGAPVKANRYSLTDRGEDVAAMLDDTDVLADDELRQEVKLLRKQVSDLQARADEAERERAAAEREREELRAEVDEAQALFKKVERMVDALEDAGIVSYSAGDGDSA